MTAVEAWAAQLRAWAIPQYLLDAVDQSPYGWPQHLWSRRTESAERQHGPSATTTILRRELGESGTLLDVGAGRGRASLPLAGEGHRLIAVEKDAGMASGLRADAAAAGVDVDVVEGPWPESSDRVGTADVSMCANVVYDVQDLGPFIEALAAVARRTVVVELTERHPWADLAPYYRRLHELVRPAGPTYEDFIGAVSEIIGFEPRVERWSRDGHLWFADWDELLEYQGRRLVLPASRREELRDLLSPDVVEVDGRLYLGPLRRAYATVWWHPGR